jgi:hypothetical protein
MEQRNKNIILLVSLSVLSLISIALLVSGNSSTEEIDATLFRLADPKTVDKVTFERIGGNVELQFSNSRWRVNGVHEADADLIDVLFATVAQVVPKREVASRLRDSIASQVLQSGIKVSFFTGAAIQKEFYVFGQGEGSQTYFLDRENKVPYVMAIPGYKVYVAGIFEQDSSTWRDKRIFSFNWRNFNELSAEFPRDTKQNFTVAMTGRYFSIVGETNIDTTALNNYLDAISLIRADAFYKQGASPKADSVSQSSPIMVIRVKDVASQTFTLQLFEIGQGERNALAKWNDDFVWFDRRNILQVYKKKKDFVKR